MKRLLRNPRTLAVLAALLAGYGKLVFLTCRIRVITPVPPAVTHGPAIFAVWHQNITAIPLLTRPNPAPLTVLMSASRDGTLTRHLARWFGISAVVGSSSRGAISGARALVQAARSGRSLALTPDGPRGPLHIAKPGATEIARLTRLPLIPCAGWAHSGHTFRSWDKFRLPYPFTTITLAYGEPLATLTPETLQLTLNQLTAQAQAAAGALASPAPKS